MTSNAIPIPRGNIPDSFLAGETVEWKDSFTKYPANDGWTMRWRFRGNHKLDVNSVADGGSFKTTLSSTQSSDLSHGNYAFQALVEKSDKKYFVRQGIVEVVRSLADYEEPFDTRTYEEQLLEAVEAVLLNRATEKHASYTIGNRNISLLSPTELMKMRVTLRRTVNFQKAKGWNIHSLQFCFSDAGTSNIERRHQYLLNSREG